MREECAFDFTLHQKATSLLEANATIESVSLVPAILFFMIV
jgi:hypothetical protein